MTVASSPAALTIWTAPSTAAVSTWVGTAGNPRRPWRWPRAAAGSAEVHKRHVIAVRELCKRVAQPELASVLRRQHDIHRREARVPRDHVHPGHTTPLHGQDWVGLPGQHGVR